MLTIAASIRNFHWTNDKMSSFGAYVSIFAFVMTLAATR